MKHDTQLAYNLLLKQFSNVYGVDNPAKTFAASPSVAQVLQDKIVEQSDFLQRINVVGVTELRGQKIYGSTSGPMTKRTDTQLNDRQPVNVLNLDTDEYLLSKTESDHFINYITLDQWAKFPDFQARYARYVQRQIAMDRIMVGFHGTSIAAETDIAANPLLQDVNKGWLQLAREIVPQQILTQGAITPNEIQIGEGGDYENLDALVNDVSNLIDDPFRESGDLVAIVGRGLLASEKGKLYAAQGQTPTEKQIIETQQVIGTYGGYAAHTVPHFPTNGLMITSFDNLSIYYQESSWRRKIDDNPKRDRIDDYNSRNEGYVIEQYGKFAAVEPTSVQFI